MTKETTIVLLGLRNCLTEINCSNNSLKEIGVITIVCCSASSQTVKEIKEGKGYFFKQ